MVVVEDLGLATREVSHGRGEAALELVVVVAVEQVVLAIVLVVQHQLDACQPTRQLAFGGNSLDPAAVGMAAPGEPGPGEVAIVPPAALVDQRLQPSTIGARAAAEDPPCRPPQRLALRHPCRLETLGLGARRSRERIVGLWLVQCGHRAAGIVQQLDLRRKGVAEEARDAQRDVDPRPPQDRERHHFDAGDAAAVAVPDGPAAHQGQGLRDIVAAGAHVGGAPGRQRHLARPGPVSLQILLDHQPGRAPAQLPGCRRGHGTAIDRVEIAPGRQNLGPTSGRCPAGPGWHTPSVQPGKQARQLKLPARHHRRPQPGLDLRQHRPRCRPGRPPPALRPRPAAGPGTPAARPCRPRCARCRLRRARRDAARATDLPGWHPADPSPTPDRRPVHAAGTRPAHRHGRAGSAPAPAAGR